MARHKFAMLTLKEQPFRGSPETSRILSAAEGWSYLGLQIDALRELEEVPEEEQCLLQVLIAKIRILFHLKRWKKAFALAQEGMKRYQNEDEFVVQAAFALFKLRLKERAMNVISGAPEWIKGTGILYYNLACYHAKFDNCLTISRKCMEAAIKVNPGIEESARKDSDLAELWK